jgi:hypothetical protein
MLTDAEARTIYERGFSVFHDYGVCSLFYGEPFLEAGELTYFDGRVATISGFPLHGTETKLTIQQRERVWYWAGEVGAESIVYYGLVPIDLSFLADLGFRRIWWQSRQQIAAELAAECVENARNIGRGKPYRSVRDSKFEVEYRNSGIVSSEYLSLVEQFFARKDLDSYLVDLTFSISALLRSEGTRLIGVRRGTKLAGFATLHKPFCDIAVAKCFFHDGVTSGVSDFLYSRLLTLGYRLGARWVNLGQSPTTGIYRFKQKWGGLPIVAPFYGAHWAKGRLALSRFCSWGPRLVKLSNSCSS